MDVHVHVLSAEHGFTNCNAQSVVCVNVLCTCIYKLSLIFLPLYTVLRRVGKVIQETAPLEERKRPAKTKTSRRRQKKKRAKMKKAARV